jgi:hypothetical protein
MANLSNMLTSVHTLQLLVYQLFYITLLPRPSPAHWSAAAEAPSPPSVTSLLKKPHALLHAPVAHQIAMQLHCYLPLQQMLASCQTQLAAAPGCCYC